MCRRAQSVSGQVRGRVGTGDTDDQSYERGRFAPRPTTAADKGVDLYASRWGALAG